MWALRVQFNIESSIATMTDSLARGNGFVALSTAAPHRFQMLCNPERTRNRTGERLDEGMRRLRLAMIYHGAHRLNGQ